MAGHACFVLDVEDVVGGDGAVTSDPLGDKGLVDAQLVGKGSVTASDFNGASNRGLVHGPDFSDAKCSSQELRWSRSAKVTNSIAAMSKAPSTPEAAALSDGIRSASITKAAIADHMDVSPGMVSQWCSGHRPVPADKATRLAKLLGLDPRQISAAFRGVSDSSEGNVVPLRRDQPLDPRSQELVIARLENDVHALNIAVGTLAAVMVSHRPAEALDAVAALRRRVPAKFQDRGFVHELIALLDKAAKR